MEIQKHEGERQPVEVTSGLKQGLGLCGCTLWANHDLGRMILTGHHENCPGSPAVMDATRELLAKLVRGIEYWASQEDGVPDEIWDA